jgi:hypothetical protein
MGKMCPLEVIEGGLPEVKVMRTSLRIRLYKEMIKMSKL